MLKTKFHIRGKHVFQKVLLLAVLFVYLVVPFKNHFLNSAHVISHLILFENPVHVHTINDGGHSFNHIHEHEHIHDHHHGALELLSQALNEFNKEKALPVELLTFRFQVEIPSELIQLKHELNFIVRKVWNAYKIKILSDLFFGVPTPPP